MLKETRVLLDIIQSNRLAVAGLVAIILLNSIFNMLSLVSVFPLIEFIFYDASQSTQAAPDAYSKVSLHVRAFLEYIGLGVGRYPVVALIVGVFALKSTLSVLTVYCTYGFSQKIRRLWVDIICRRYFYAPFRSVAQQSTGVIANNILREPTQAAQFVRAYLDCMNRVLLSATIVVGMLYVEWRLVAAFFTGLAVIYPILKFTLFDKSAANGKRNIALSQSVIGITTEMSGSIKQIHILGIEEYSRHRIMQVMRELSRLLVAIQTIKELPRVLVEFFVVVVGLAALLLVEATYDGDLRLILPSLIFFGIALSRLTGMFAEIMSLQVLCVNKAPSADLLVEIFQDRQFDSAGEPESGRLPFRGLDTDIHLRNVSFSYDPQTPVLDRLSCVIPRGKLTCFIGPSGCGKSTLMDLLMRLYDPDGGSIECGGRDIREYRLADWRAKIGYISQDASTFSVSLRENVTFGREDVSDDKLDELAAILRLDRLVTSMESGWDTVIGEGGVTLSGGERKRIAIARALLAGPDLLIFDEATVSFQEGLEQDLLSQIRSHWPSISIVLITHRLSTIRAADLVHVLDRGHVVASGAESEVRAVAQTLLVTPEERAPKEPAAPGAALHLDLETG